MVNFDAVNIDKKYMQRCLSLAKNGLGATYPNPLVGCVIVYQDIIIGEGWHKKSGEPHAEVNAIKTVKDQSLLKKSTIYVSLEPCSHFGKTPPCSDLIISKKIPRVVIGTVDPNEKVAGKGIKKLENAGIRVSTGILEKECNELNKRFFTFHEKKRPYVILKWAQTANGFLAPKSKMEQKPYWISNEYSRQLVHKWRSEEKSILVGTQTAADDNPKLDLRDWAGNSPVRIVLDQSDRLPKHLHLFDSSLKTIVFAAMSSSITTENIIVEVIDFNKNIGRQILNTLYKHQIQSVIVEGGAQTIQNFIKENLWDEARVLVGKTSFEEGLLAPKINFKEPQMMSVDTDQLLIYNNHD